MLQAAEARAPLSSGFIAEPTSGRGKQHTAARVVNWTHLGVSEAAYGRKGVGLDPGRHALEDATLGARADQLHMPHPHVYTCLPAQAQAACITRLDPRYVPVMAPASDRCVLQERRGAAQGVCRRVLQCAGTCRRWQRPGPCNAVEGGSS